MGTDRDWENWGRTDPYYGVLSDATFRRDAMTRQSKDAFFASGEEHVIALLETIRRRFLASFSPRQSLDFGCGVGRLLIPLAKRSASATGVDISTSMITEARHNCAEFGILNVDFIESDDRLSRLQAKYDLVHSHIVFAHIHPSRGIPLIRRLAEAVNPGGFIAIQILYACNAPRLHRTLAKVRYRIPPLNAMRNLLRGRPASDPAMQLHVYELGSVLRSLHNLGFRESHLVLDSFEDDTFDSVVVIAQRPGIVT